ncbi:MAG: J domain-containing protein [Alphaproteobacteria bacterium]|nr:J domain-containing protein [Alphaproteobacteria bacterium]
MRRLRSQPSEPFAGAAHAGQKPCDHPGCAQIGDFRAPRSRDALNTYFWFCLEHVRAYNAAWDFYAGMSPDEIERAVRADVTWQRPTWPLGRGGATRPERGEARRGPRMHDPFGFFDDDEAEPTREAPPTPESRAMRLLELELPLTMAALKTRYRELVKRHHPDANPGDSGAEERFKEISQAYRTLMTSLTA